MPSDGPPGLKHDLSLGWAWHWIDGQAQPGADGPIEHAKLLGQGVQRTVVAVFIVDA
jgi:hypothetical protein